jgi:hypothetical protein
MDRALKSLAAITMAAAMARARTRFAPRLAMACGACLAGVGWDGRAGRLNIMLFLYCWAGADPDAA